MIKTVNTGAIAYVLYNVDVQVSMEKDEITGMWLYCIPNTNETSRLYGTWLKVLKNGEKLMIDIVQYNHIFSVLKRMAKEYRYK